jgi:gas vesicle protein
MNGVWSSLRIRRVTAVALALMAVAAGGVLAGCGSDSNNVESSIKKEVQAGTKKAEEGLQQGTEEAEKALEEAKGEVSGEGSKKFKEGIEEAQEGVKNGKAQGQKEIEEVKKQIEEATE